MIYQDSSTFLHHNTTMATLSILSRPAPNHNTNKLHFSIVIIGLWSRKIKHSKSLQVFMPLYSPKMVIVMTKQPHKVISCISLFIVSLCGFLYRQTIIFNYSTTRNNRLGIIPLTATPRSYKMGFDTSLHLAYLAIS